MFKKLLSVTLALVMILGIGTNVFATGSSNVDLDLVNKEMVYVRDESNTSVITPMGPLYEFFWAVSSTDKVDMYFGSWRDGPSGEGPARLSINEGTNLNRSFTASLSGEYPVGKGAIGASLGIRIDVAQSYGTSYSIDIPSNTIRTIIYRPKIDVYKVTQTYYRMNSITGEVTSMDTKIAYVDAFNNWDYSWRNGY